MRSALLDRNEMAYWDQFPFRRVEFIRYWSYFFTFGMAQSLVLELKNVRFPALLTSFEPLFFLKNKICGKF